MGRSILGTNRNRKNNRSNHSSWTCKGSCPCCPRVVFTNTDYNEIYSYMKYTNVASYSTAIAIGMRKVKEYLDLKNDVFYAYSIKRADWENIIAGQKT